MRLLGSLVVPVVVVLALAACSHAPDLGREPTVQAAHGYARTLAAVLSGGDIGALAEYATADQIDRVNRYRMMLQGERGERLGARLDRWNATAVDSRSDAALVRAEERWTTQTLDAESGKPVGPVESRSIVTEYELVLTNGAWLVNDLTERSAEEKK